MRIAVTGGSGQIGAYVCDELAGAGHEVVCVDRVAPKADVAFVEADLCSLEQAAGAIAGFDQVMHLAADRGQSVLRKRKGRFSSSRLWARLSFCVASPISLSLPRPQGSANCGHTERRTPH